MKTTFHILALCAAALVPAARAQACTQSPADPKADDAARALVCYLSTHTYISGQTDMADAERVKQQTGRFPAIVAFDFYSYTDGDLSQTQKAIDFHKKTNGIVAFQWHWKAPAPGGRGEYYTDWDYPSALNDANSQLRKDIRLVVGELKKMGDAGVPVLFRPLHEANNNFMWWQRHGQDNYRKLWKLLFDEAAAAGAHNLVWNFNGMASEQGTSLASWYPGDGLVDVISSDYYQAWSDYDLMKKIGTNKILGVAETWFALDPAKDPPFSHSVVWASRDWPDPKHGGVEAVNRAWATAMASAKTISIDQVPPMVPVATPRIVAPPRSRRFSNTLATVRGVEDLAAIFQDTSKLVYTVSSSGSSAIAATLSGTRVDLTLRTGDTGTAVVKLVATNALKLSASVEFRVFLKDYHKGNLALHQNGFASSNDAYGSGPDAAFDGDGATRWSSDWADGEWLAVDLDSVLAVDSVTLSWEDAFGTGFGIEVSTDSVSWTRVASRVGGIGGVEGFRFPKVQARFVRMKGESRATKYGYSLWEMGVYGPEGLATGVGARADRGARFVRMERRGALAALRIEAQGEFDVVLRDAAGATVLVDHGAGSSRIACGRLRAGVYLARVRDASGWRDARLLLEP